MAAVAETLGLASSAPSKSHDRLGVRPVIARMRKFTRAAVGKVGVRTSRALLKSELPNASIIGLCHVKVVAVDLPCRSPFLIFRVEAEEVKVRPHEQEGEIDICLPLTSLPSLVDLHVHAFDDLSVRLRPHGRVVVPLGPVLFPSVQDSINLMKAGGLCTSSGELRSPERRLHLRMLPASKRSHARSSSAPPGHDELVEKLKPAIKGVPGSGHFGNRVDVEATFGTVELLVHVELCSSTAVWQELLRPPWQPSGDPMPIKTTQDEVQEAAAEAFTKLKPKLLKQGQDRLWKCFAMPPLFRLVLENSLLVGISAISWFVVILWFPGWSYPLFFWVLLVVNGLLGFQAKDELWRKGDTLPPDECAYRVWEDQTGDRAVSYGVTQIMQVQFALYEMQVLLNGGAAVMERIQSLVEFADPALSIMAHAVVLLFCLCFSMALFCGFVREILAVVGAVILVALHIYYDEFESVAEFAERLTMELRSTKFGLKKPKWGFGSDRRLRGSSDHVSREKEAPARSNSKESTKVSSPRRRQRDADFEEQQTANDGDESDMEMQTTPTQYFRGLAEYFKGLAFNAQEAVGSFFARVPTDPELAHRYIALSICNASAEEYAATSSRYTATASRQSASSEASGRSQSKKAIRKESDRAEESVGPKSYRSSSKVKPEAAVAEESVGPTSYRSSSKVKLEAAVTNCRNSGGETSHKAQSSEFDAMQLFDFLGEEKPGSLEAPLLGAAPQQP